MTARVPTPMTARKPVAPLVLPARPAPLALRPQARARPAAFEPPATPKLDMTAPPSALERWDAVAGLRAAGEEGDNVITMYESIGYDPWTGGGVTAKRVSAALRSIGKRDVEVRINSFGGDLFEGVAILNMLVAHPGAVTVKVIGMAASAASLIAMAGDELLMGRASFLMIHNCWSIAIGNKGDFRRAADDMEQFDAAMAGVYAERSGQDRKKVEAWMDAESYFGGERAVELGFADALLDDSDITNDTAAASLAQSVNAVRRADNLMARAGASRSERRDLLKNLTGGKPGAAPSGMPGAADTAWLGQAAELISAFQA